MSMKNILDHTAGDLTGDSFYLVLRDTDGQLKRHVSREGAETEAARLAAKHPGSTFYVLVPVTAADITPTPVQLRKLDLSA
jgi:hypothetical protein